MPRCTMRSPTAIEPTTRWSRPSEPVRFRRLAHQRGLYATGVLGAMHAATCTACKLFGDRGRTPDDGRDLIEWQCEHIVQRESEPA